MLRGRGKATTIHGKSETTRIRKRSSSRTLWTVLRKDQYRF